MKRLLPVFLALLLLLIPITALGATNNTSTGKLIQPLTYQTISGGGSQLSDNGNGNITISGYTSTYYPVSQIGLTLHLQYLKNGNWYTLQTYNYTSANASNVSGGQNLGVSSGYYYRVFAEHTAYNGSTYETGYSYTEAVYIP
ncbi:hypothetical protein [Desulfosporosinus sp. OT]|uniref:hypothetical protein n=1 Tax=Desulfosporosinus sp. OT TaxID=913865 RepID=UPI000223A2E8|nr:hypothetical protein [Desulfosporosinus sp. OT]EGW38525.1 hypothetical protein DOT_3588 [Desulfosporosinus sp. OT]